MSNGISHVSLAWVSVAGLAGNLVSQHVCDFDVYDSFEFQTQGQFGVGALVGAGGVVLDNLDNAAFIDVIACGVASRLAPFSRDGFPIKGGAARVLLSGRAGIVRVSFFTQAFPGALQGANVYGAIKSVMQGN